MRRTQAIADTHLHKAGLLLVFVTIFAALYFAQDVFIPLALSFLLTFVLSPVADWLERRKFPRVLAAVLVVGVVCSMTLGLGYVVGDQLVRFAEDLPKYQDEISSKIRTFQGTGSGLTRKISKSFDDIERAASQGNNGGSGSSNGATNPAEASTQSTTAPPTSVTQATGERIADVGRSMQVVASSQPAELGTSAKNPLFVLDASAKSPPLGNLTAYLSIILGPLGTAAAVLVLVLFMLLEREDLRDRFIRLSSGGKYTLTTQALNDATTRISRYLRALLIVNGSYGIAIGTGLWLIGLTFGHGVTFPSFILWGVLCGVLRFIPYVGPWVAAIFPIAVSLATYEGFGVFFATAAMFVVIELVSNSVMEPILYGSSTGISTVALLIAAIVWTWLWGAYGLLLSTPLTVCLVVLGKHVPQLNFLDVMLGDQPALPPGVRFYQRLLAGNGADATAVAHEYAVEHGQIAASDDVVLPAIRLARQDRDKDDLTADEEVALYATAADIVAAANDRLKTSRDPTRISVPAESVAEAKALVLGIPSHHRAELIALKMVENLLDPIGGRLKSLACSLLPSDVEGQVELEKPAALFIGVIPPGGLSQARYLCRRLRRKFKDLPIVVGYFGTYRNYDALLVKFRAAGASYVTTSIGQSRSQLASLLKLEIDPAVDLIQSGHPPEERSQTSIMSKLSPDALLSVLPGHATLKREAD